MAPIEASPSSPEVEEIPGRKKTSALELLLDVLASLDVDEYLRAAGVAARELDTVRVRLRGQELSA